MTPTVLPRCASRCHARNFLENVSLALLTALSFSLSGCMNLSGVGGDSRYGCKAPEGVACQSVSGVYANAVATKTVGQPQTGRPRLPDPKLAASTSPSRVSGRVLGDERIAQGGNAQGQVQANSEDPLALLPTDGGLLRSPARILRLWFKPWEDADRDLYDQGYVYVRVDNGQWLIDHAQQRIRDAYAPVRPPRASAATAAGANEPAAAPAPSRPLMPKDAIKRPYPLSAEPEIQE